MQESILGYYIRRSFMRYIGRGSFPAGKEAKLTTHLHLVPRSRMPGAMPLLPKYAFITRCSIKAQGELYLYLAYFC
jgi:hypothetical protein